MVEVISMLRRSSCPFGLQTSPSSCWG